MKTTLFLFFTFCSTLSFSQIIYVDADATGSNDGSSWANAYTSLQFALPLATASNQIWVAEGVYTPHASDRTVSFNILTGTELYGGFDGTETLLSESDPTNNVTILSGDLAGNDNNILLHTEPTRQDNTYQIVAIKGTNISGIIIAGFTITGGNANGTISTAGGASIQYNRERGAAIATQSFAIGTTISAAFQKCIIEKNTATSVAGYSHFYPSGITNVFCYIDFASCVFRNNYSVSNATVLYHGGGYYQQYNRGNQINCLFYNNTSINAASAIQCINSTYDPLNNANVWAAARINVVNSTFTENTGFNSKVIKVTLGDVIAIFVRNSIVFNNGSTSPFEFDGFGGGVGTQNTITTDPTFLDPTNDNFRLSCTSASRDVGNNAYIAPYTTDLDGLTRINNTTVDQGCYEFIDAVALTAIAQDITVELDALGNAIITPAEVDNGSLTNCGGLPFTLNLDITSFDCSNLGTNTVILTADDGVTTSTATATVTVLPYAEAQDITVQLDASGNATIIATDLIAIPNPCPAMILTIDNATFTCADIGTNAVLLTVSDGNGNISTDYGIVTVEDNVPPIVFTQDISVAINISTGIATITPAMIDNGSTDNCSLTLSLSQTEFLCEDQGVNSVTLTATDGEGNQSTGTANVTVTSPLLNYSSTAADPTLCFGNSGTTITTAGSEIGISYLLLDDNDIVIDGPEAGTGAAIVFNTGAIPTTTAYNVVAQKVYSTNGAVDLDGINDIINLSNNNRGVTSTVTVSLRIKTSVVPAANQYVMSKYNGTAGITMYIDVQGKIAFYGRDGGAAKTSGLSTTIVTDNQWHEVTGVVRNTGWEIYIDGVLENSGAYPLGTGLTNASNFNIGNYSTSYSPVDIDNLTLWNTALTPAQILANANTCLVGTEPNLTAYFKFDEGAGTTVTDLSPTAINGTLTNMSVPACWINGSIDACAVYCNTEMTPSVTVLVQDLLAPVPNTPVLLDINGSCSVTSLTAPDATDDCSGVVIGAHNATLPIITSSTVTWSYDDGNGNISTQTQNVVINDVIAPVADIAVLTTLTDQCAISTLVAPTATDNCVGAISGTPDVTLPVTSSTLITWTFDDGNGNTATQTQNIIIDDITAPVPDVNTLSSINAECSVSSLIAPTATDNCMGSIMATHNAILPITSSTIITWTYDDGNGNTNTQTQNVVINDVTAPIADLGVLPDLTEQCSITSLIPPTATDNCMGSIIGSHNETLPITSNASIIWTFDDGNGNISTQLQNVVLNDITAPIADLVTLTTLADNCAITSLSAPTATDNCDGTIIGTHNATLPITNTTTITWTFVDGNGNISTQDQSILINDVTAPVVDIATLADLTDECSISFLTAPTATDNCIGTLNGTHNATLPITSSTIVTWTFDDGNGNTTTQTQNVIIDDITNPAPDLGTLPDLTEQCSINFLVPPTATDNCSGSIIGTHSESLPITTNTTIQWTFDDGNGNISTQTQNVVLNDFTAPVADIGSLSTLTDECSIASLIAPTATDNCNGSIIGTHNETLPITSSTTVTWTYDDGNGNISTQNQSIVIDDVTSPVADNVALVDLSDPCSISVLTAPTATDNCVGLITGTHNATLPITSSSTITWTYDDGNGNTSTQVQNVIINDLTPPVADIVTLTDVVSECEVNSLTAPTATDNCSGTINATHSETFPITSSTTVTWTYEDANGNTSTQIQNIIIDDNTAPVPDQAQLIEIESYCPVNSINAPFATDNCIGSISGTTSAIFPISSTTTITWTFDDGNGNTSTQDQLVTINSIDPSVTIVDITMTSNQGGATYQWVDCNNGNSPIVGATNSSFTPIVNGSYAVEITIGNCTEISSCTAITTVGINELKANHIKIYPNPTSSTLTIETESAIESVHIFSVNGKFVQSETSNKFSVESLTTGVYLINVKTVDGVYTERFIKE